MSILGPRLREIQWKQPLRADEIALLLVNLLDEHPVVAVSTLRAIVRLSLTPRAWTEVAAKSLELLRRSARFDDTTRGEALGQACRILHVSTRSMLCRMLDERLSQPLRERLLMALAREREPSVVPHLLRALKSSIAAERLAASRELSRYCRFPHVPLLDRLSRERDWPTRFWLAFALAVDGTPEPLCAFFHEPRPREYQDWGTVVGSDDSVQFVLAERAQRLPAAVRRMVGAIRLPDWDPARELQNVLAISDNAPAHESLDADGLLELSEADLEEATRTVQRWIEAGPEWESDVQILWDDRKRREALSRVDARIRGRAVSALFSYQFAKIRSEAPGALANGMDGGVYMCVIVGSILEGALGIDVEEIFRLYWENVREPVYPQIQLATAAAFASPREVLLACQEALRSNDPELRTAAASFVELACRYAGALSLPGWGSDDSLPDATKNGEVIAWEQAEVLHYDPRVDCPHSASPGERVKIVVDLLNARGGRGDVRLEGISADWETLLVDVAIVAPKIRLSAGREKGIIELHRDACASPYAVEGVVEPDAGPEDLQVYALFSFRGRSAGWAEARIAIGKRTVQVPIATAPIAIATEAKVAPLSLVFLRQDGSEEYTYEVLTTEEFRNLEGMPQGLTGSTRIPRVEVTSIRESIDLIADKMDDHDQALANLNGVADIIFSKLPPAFRDTYQAIRAKLGDSFPIQFITNDPGIPWELSRPSCAGKRKDILCTTHPVARWHPNQYPSARTDLHGKGAILTVAPRYAKDNALPLAQTEARFMAELGARKLRAPISRGRFMASLRGERLAVLHIAAHGEFLKNTPLLSRVILEGKEFVTASEIRSESKTALERGLVMLNVCEGGAAGGQLGGAIVGLAESFLEHGAAAVIAPLWSVPDREAMEMTKRCLPRVLKGSAIADVLRDARHGDAPSIHPLAYLMWGDVTAAFS